MERAPLALVTGASRGIGASAARTLAQAGARLVLGARGRDELERLADELRAGGAEAHAVPLDVTDADSVRDAARVALELGEGRVDWLVNNAGIARSGPLLPRAGRPGQEHEAHLEVNLHGPRRMVEALAPAMLAAGGGAIVNVASSAALRGYAYVAAYCASKHALLGYARCGALETASAGLRWYAVCPHYVDSPMLAASVERVVASTGRSPEQARAFFAAQNPGGALVTPQDVAAAIRDCCTGRHAPGVVELDGARVARIESWDA